MAGTQVAQALTTAQLDQLCVNTIRTLAMDAVQQANSGHPGTPMGMAPVAYCLWQHFLRFDPNHPIWPNRDRFVLSVGHASTTSSTFANWTANVPATPNTVGRRVSKRPPDPWDRGWRPVLGWRSPRGGLRATSIDQASSCSITMSTRFAAMDA